MSEQQLENIARNAFESMGMQAMLMFWNSIGVETGEYDHDGSQDPAYAGLTLDQKLNAVKAELQAR